MAETYKVNMTIRVIKGDDGEAIADEEYLFPGQSFSKMANLADEFYTLVNKLQKIK